jgi:HEAT repeat protein
VAASRQKIAIIPLIRVLADQSPGVKNAALIALEGLKELMPPDIGRFFELFKRVVNQKKPIRFHEKFFLKQFAKEHKDLGDVVQKLMKKE